MTKQEEKDREKQIFDRYGNYDFPTDIKQESLNSATTQIEEMAKVVKNSLSLHIEKTIIYPYIAQDLYACGYRKIDCENYVSIEWHDEQVMFAKDEIERLNNEYDKSFERLKQQQREIIILKEENEQLSEYLDCSKKENECVVEQARKDTAREILYKVKDFLIKNSCSYMDLDDTFAISATLDECFGELNKLIEEYGVEVEE